METMRVTPAGGDRFAIALRGHEIMVDQPADVGGTDIGPTPTELFVAGLVSCVAVYAGRFLARHGVCAEGLRVDADWEMGEGSPARVGCVTIRITAPPALPASRLPGGIDRPADYVRLAEALVERGWSDTDVIDFAAGNWMRIFG